MSVHHRIRQLRNVAAVGYLLGTTNVCLLPFVILCKTTRRDGPLRLYYVHTVGTCCRLSALLSTHIIFFFIIIIIVVVVVVTIIVMMMMVVMVMFMIMPVSYTHLDVYKRQMQRIGLEEGQCCLLYTSRCV